MSHSSSLRDPVCAESAARLYLFADPIDASLFDAS
jgi:hypothetical protein